jgi:hypothetical protein
MIDDLNFYRESQRWVVEQHLALSPSQRSALRDYLSWNLQPQNRQYRYDYFTSNCSTRVRDALDRVLGGALRRQLEAQAAGTTYRAEAVRLIAPEPTLAALMDLALGPRADRPLNQWQLSFIPMQLMQALRGVQVTGPDGTEAPLVSAEEQLLPDGQQVPPAQPPDLRLPFAVAGLVFAGLLLALASRRPHKAARIAFAAFAAAFSLACGLVGLLFVALWTLTQHWAGWDNENLLLFDPLCVLLVPASVGAAWSNWRPGRRQCGLAGAVALLAAASLVLRLEPRLFQANTAWIALLLPPHLALLFCLRRAARRPALAV